MSDAAFDLAEYQRRQALVDRQRRDADRELGKADQLLRTLGREFGVVHEAAGRALLAKLRARITAYARRYAEGWREVQDAYTRYCDDRAETGQG